MLEWESHNLRQYCFFALRASFRAAPSQVSRTQIEELNETVLSLSLSLGRGSLCVFGVSGRMALCGHSVCLRRSLSSFYSAHTPRMRRWNLNFSAPLFLANTSLFSLLTLYRGLWLQWHSIRIFSVLEGWIKKCNCIQLERGVGPLPHGLSFQLIG